MRWATDDEPRCRPEASPPRATVRVEKAVLWLASDDSDYVHGHALSMDGGMTLYPEFREGG